MSEDKQNNKYPNKTLHLMEAIKFAVRQAKLDQMRENGIDPFRANWEQTHTSTEAQALLTEDMEEGPEVSVAGRIVAFRLMGKASFLKVLDRDGRIRHM
jgi:lysyl-tRNA synthetase class 2